jgi:hypothetical protein
MGSSERRSGTHNEQQTVLLKYQNDRESGI